MTDLTMSQFASKDDLLAAQAARIAELESQLEAIGAGGVEPLRKQAAAPQEEAIAEIVSASHDQAEFGECAINFLRDFQHLEYGTKLYPAPQAVQAAVQLPLLVRDIARDLGITVPQACIALKPLGNYSTNSAVTAEMARMLRDNFPAPAHPAEAVPAQCPNINEPRGCWRVACQLGGKCREPERSATQPAAQGMEALPMQASEGAEDVAVMEHPEWMLVHKETGAQKPLDSQWTVRATQPAAQGAATTGYIAPKGRYVPPVLFSPYTGEPRDARDIASDPRGILIVPPGAALAAQAKQGGV